MNDRDCESCKKFSRNDPHESEGYCQAKRSWVDPQEGEDCKMHEFTLHSATKYKDGTPIMSEPEKVYCESDADLIHGKTDAACKSALNSAYGKTAEMTNQLDTKSSRPNQFGIDFCEPDCCPYWDKYCDHTLQDKHMCPYLPHDTDANVKYLEQAFTEFAKIQDDLIEEYDATLKIHGDTLEQHLERIDDMDAVLTRHAGKINTHADMLEEHLNRICELEHLYEKVIDYVCELREKVDKIVESFTEHKGSDFCGNCTHVNRCRAEDGIYACELSGEIIDPDDSSCARFEPPYSKNPEWFDNMKKAMTTPSEPSVGCTDCKHVIHGMCEKYNCSLGTICATPECHESFPF